MRVVGDSPFGVDRASVIAAVKSLNVDEAIPHRRPDGSSVPPVLRSIISQCLRIDPMDRPTAEQVLTLLHAAIDSAFVAPVSTSASSTPPIAEMTMVALADPAKRIKFAELLQELLLR